MRTFRLWPLRGTLAVVLLLAWLLGQAGFRDSLGSWWGLAPAIAASLLFIWRAVDEDRFLRERLEGYADYAGPVHHRLLPGVW